VKTAPKNQDWKRTPFTDIHAFTVSCACKPNQNETPPCVSLQSLSVSLDSRDSGKICFSTIKRQNGESVSEIFVESFERKKKASATVVDLKNVFSRAQLCFTSMFNGIACSFPDYLPLLPESRVTISESYLELFAAPQKKNDVLTFAHAKVTAQISKFYTENYESLVKLATVQDLQYFFMEYVRNAEESSSLHALDFSQEVLPAFVNGLQVARLLEIGAQTVTNGPIVWKQFSRVDEILGSVMIVTKSLSRNRYEVRNQSGVVVGWFYRQHLQQLDPWNQPWNIPSGSTVVCPADNITRISSDTPSVPGTVLRGSSDFTDGSFLVRRINGSLLTGTWGVISGSERSCAPEFNCRIIKRSQVSNFYEQGFRWCSGNSSIRCEALVQFCHSVENDGKALEQFYCSGHSSLEKLKRLSFFHQDEASAVEKKCIDVDLRYTVDFFGNFPDALSSPLSDDLLQFPWEEWSSDVDKMVFEYLKDSSEVTVKVFLRPSETPKKFQNGDYITFFGDWPPSDFDVNQASVILTGTPYKVAVDSKDESKPVISLAASVPFKVNTWEAKFSQSDKVRFLVRLSCIASKDDDDDVVVRKNGKSAKYLESSVVPFSADVPQLCPGLVLQMSKPQFNAKRNHGKSVITPGIGQRKKFHPAKNFMLFGFLYVAFDSKADPTCIATLYSRDVEESAVGDDSAQGVGIGICHKSRLRLVPVDHINDVFETFLFSPRGEKEDSSKLQVGDVVVRGKHWKWGNQDGGGTGRVTDVDEKSDWVGVKWDKNGDTNKFVVSVSQFFSLTFCRYRYAEGKYDLKKVIPKKQGKAEYSGIEIVQSGSQFFLVLSFKTFEADDAHLNIKFQPDSEWDFSVSDAFLKLSPLPKDPEDKSHNYRFSFGDGLKSIVCETPAFEHISEWAVVSCPPFHSLLADSKCQIIPYAVTCRYFLLNDKLYPVGFDVPVSQSAPKGLKCKLGHFCSPQTFEGSNRCKTCKSKIRAGERGLRCQQCGFCVCAKCTNDSAAENVETEDGSAAKKVAFKLVGPDSSVLHELCGCQTIKCNSGHICTPKSYSYDLSCDKCGGKIDSGSEGLACRQCYYDTCARCSSTARATASELHLRACFDQTCFQCKRSAPMFSYFCDNCGTCIPPQCVFTELKPKTVDGPFTEQDYPFTLSVDAGSIQRYRAVKFTAFDTLPIGSEVMITGKEKSQVFMPNEVLKVVGVEHKQQGPAFILRLADEHGSVSDMDGAVDLVGCSRTESLPISSLQQVIHGTLNRNGGIFVEGSRFIASRSLDSPHSGKRIPALLIQQLVGTVFRDKKEKETDVCFIVWPLKDVLHSFSISPDQTSQIIVFDKQTRQRNLSAVDELRKAMEEKERNGFQTKDMEDVLDVLVTGKQCPVFEELSKKPLEWNFPRFTIIRCNRISDRNFYPIYAENQVCQAVAAKVSRFADDAVGKDNRATPASAKEKSGSKLFGLKLKSNTRTDSKPDGDMNVDWRSDNVNQSFLCEKEVLLNLKFKGLKSKKFEMVRLPISDLAEEEVATDFASNNSASRPQILGSLAEIIVVDNTGNDFDIDIDFCREIGKYYQVKRFIVRHKQSNYFIGVVFDIKGNWTEVHSCDARNSTSNKLQCILKHPLSDIISKNSIPHIIFTVKPAQEKAVFNNEENFRKKVEECIGTEVSFHLKKKSESDASFCVYFSSLEDANKFDDSARTKFHIKEVAVGPYPLSSSSDDENKFLFFIELLSTKHYRHFFHRTELEVDKTSSGALQLEYQAALSRQLPEIKYHLKIARSHCKGVPVAPGIPNFLEEKDYFIFYESFREKGKDDGNWKYAQVASSSRFRMDGHVLIHEIDSNSQRGPLRTLKLWQVEGCDSSSVSNVLSFQLLSSPLIFPTSSSPIVFLKPGLHNNSEHFARGILRPWLPGRVVGIDVGKLVYRVNPIVKPPSDTRNILSSWVNADIFAACCEKRIEVHTSTGEKIELSNHNVMIHSCAWIFLDKNKFALAYGCEDGTIRVCFFSDSKHLSKADVTLKGHLGTVTCISPIATSEMAHDESLACFASGSANGDIRIWKRAEGRWQSQVGTCSAFTLAQPLKNTVAGTGRERSQK
jgi:hypothetical protein